MPQTAGAELKLLVQETERMRDEVLANERCLQQFAAHLQQMKTRSELLGDRVHAMTHMPNTDENHNTHATPAVAQHTANVSGCSGFAADIYGRLATAGGLAVPPPLQVAKSTRMPLHRVGSNSMCAVDKNPRPLSPLPAGCDIECDPDTGDLLVKPDPQPRVTHHSARCASTLATQPVRHQLATGTTAGSSRSCNAR